MGKTIADGRFSISNRSQPRGALGIATPWYPKRNGRDAPVSFDSGRNSEIPTFARGQERQAAAFRPAFPFFSMSSTLRSRAPSLRFTASMSDRMGRRSWRTIRST